MSDGAPRHRPRPGPGARRPSAGYAGTVPLYCLLLAIALVAGAALTWVISPNLGHNGTVAVPNNVGTVPHGGARTKLVSYVSPHRIVIPALRAEAPIVDVGTTDRELDIPLNPKVVGWWAGGAKPGAHVGTAILAGHINYAGVSGTLAQIGTLKPGDVVYVHGKRRGTPITLKFRVTGVRSYMKTALPYRQIFDQEVAGRLAIVTCGGAFDAQTGNYLENIVVFAVLAEHHTDTRVARKASSPKSGSRDS